MKRTEPQDFERSTPVSRRALIRNVVITAVFFLMGLTHGPEVMGLSGVPLLIPTAFLVGVVSTLFIVCMLQLAFFSGLDWSKPNWSVGAYALGRPLQFPYFFGVWLLVEAAGELMRGLVGEQGWVLGSELMLQLGFGVGLLCGTLMLSVLVQRRRRLDLTNSP